MAKLVGFLVLFLVTTVDLSYSQQVNFTITPSETVVGTTGKLQCATTSKDNILYWMIKKGSEILIHFDKSLQHIDPSLRTRAVISRSQPDGKVLNVEISPVECEDEGNYTCIIKQDADTLHSPVVNWIVKDSPKDVALSATFIDVNTDQEIQIVTGNPIQLLCQAHLGNPAGHMEWYIAKVGIDEDIKESDYEKTDVNVTMSDAKPVEDSCQTAQKSSIKFYSNTPLKLSIRCQVKNELDSTAVERVFKINETSVLVNPPKAEKVSSTLIIIIVLAVIIPEIIIAIILGIVLYIRRKRLKKKRELEAAEAEEKAALPDRQSRNSFQMQPRGSSKGGRRKRDSSMKEKADAPEKQAMTGAATEA